MNVDAEFVTWAYRVLLNREPENTTVVQRVVEKNLSPSQYRDAILHSEEFRRFHSKERRPSNLNAWCWAEVEDLLLHVSLNDAFISCRILENNFDRNETKFVRSVLRRGDCAIDIGANLGYYTILFASAVGSKGRVYSFEPMPMHFDSLVKSIQRNGLGDYVTPINAAVSDTSGVVKMVFAPGSANWGGANLLGERELPSGHDTVDARVGRLGDFCAPTRLDMIKIDVEGAEPKVVRGCSEILMKFKPIILSEVHVNLLKSVSDYSPDEYVNLMASLGYECKTLTDSGELGAAVDPAKIDVIANVVFVPK